MGNRALIIAKSVWENADNEDSVPAVYVHSYYKYDLRRWLATCKERGYRSFSEDPTYALARLCQVACEDFPKGNNIGLWSIHKADKPWDDLRLDYGFVIVDDFRITTRIPSFKDDVEDDEDDDTDSE